MIIPVNEKYRISVPDSNNVCIERLIKKKDSDETYWKGGSYFANLEQCLRHVLSGAQFLTDMEQPGEITQWLKHIDQIVNKIKS